MNGLENPDIAGTVDQWVDIHRADIAAVQFHFRIDVDFTDVHANELIVIDREIQPGVRSKAPGTIETELVSGKRTFFLDAEIVV